MNIPWKLYSFWLNVIAYVCVIGAIIMFFKSLEEPGLHSLMWLLYGAVAFLCWKAFSLITRAAEIYLGIDSGQTEEQEEY